MATTMTPTELATEFSSDGKTVRKFLRSITPKDGQPGKGARWAVPANAKQVASLKKQFTKWEADEKAARAARAQAAADQAQEAADAVEEDSTEE